jgi:hypothetical protein
MLTQAFKRVAGLAVRLLAAFTVRVKASLPVKVELLLSVAVIVKVDVPVVVGVPLSTPVVALNVDHNGKLPALTANVYVPEPPVALKLALYALSAVAFANVAGPTVRLPAGFTLSV